MANRIGYSRNSNKVRTKWEEGVRRNRERLAFTVANFKTWEANDGWTSNPEYMHELELKIKRQTQYLQNRLGEFLER
jgi:hypothetical protein